MPPDSHSPIPRLVLFPGLGVDGGVFRRQQPLRDLPAVVETPGWIDPIPGETVERYSRRMAERVTPRRPGERLFLGGLSFGGMVALEAARVLEPDGVFLISSGYSHRVLAPYVRLVLKSVGYATPWQLSVGLKFTGLFARLVGRPNRRQRRLMLDLVPRINLRVCIWGGPALVRWELRERLKAPVYQIQGAIDLVVPLEKVLADASEGAAGGLPDLIVPGGGHAVNVTQAEAVNRFIARRITGRTGPTDVRLTDDECHVNAG